MIHNHHYLIGDTAGVTVLIDITPQRFAIHTKTAVEVNLLTLTIFDQLLEEYDLRDGEEGRF